MENDLDDDVRVPEEAQPQATELQYTMTRAVVNTNDVTIRGDLLSITCRYAPLPPRPLPFPHEVLEMIFMHSIDLLDEITDRARQPFRCATVCRRWRSVALGMSSLWSYIGVPVLENEDAGDFWLYIVQQLLLRSGARALHVVISLAEGEAAFSYYRPILSSLFKLLHCSRWCEFELRGDFFDTVHLETFDLLRRRTPLLESVTVAFNGQYNLRWPDEVPACLPYAPRLRHVRLANNPIAFNRASHGDEGSPMLPATSLALHAEDYDLESFAATLASFPALTTLELVCGDCESAWPISAPLIFLPEVRKLVITYVDIEGGTDVDYFTFAHVLDALELPKLRALHIPPHLLDDVEGFISRCATTLEELRLFFGRIDQGHYVTLLEPLHELREISFDSVELSRDFLVVLRDMATSIWPKLERMVFHRLSRWDTDGLLHFLRYRYPIDAASTSSCVLLEVNTEGEYLVGTQLATEIRAILDNERARRRRGK